MDAGASAAERSCLTAERIYWTQNPACQLVVGEGLAAPIANRFSFSFKFWLSGVSRRSLFFFSLKKSQERQSLFSSLPVVCSPVVCRSERDKQTV